MVNTFACVTIDDNEQQNSDVKKWHQMYCREWEIRDSPSELQIIVLIIKITKGMHVPNDFMEILTMRFTKCTL